MKRFLQIAALVFTAACGWAQTSWVVPPSPAMVDTITVPMAPWMKYYMPGPDHGFLDRLAGRWSMGDVVPPDTDRVVGKSENRIRLDGCVLEIEEHDSVGGRPRNSWGYMAYNNFRGQYELMIFDDLSTSPLFMTGQRDSLYKVVTLYGSSLGTKKTPRRFKYVIRMNSGTWHTNEFWSIAADGKESLLRAVIYRLQR